MMKTIFKVNINMKNVTCKSNWLILILSLIFFSCENENENTNTQEEENNPKQESVNNDNDEGNNDEKDTPPAISSIFLQNLTKIGQEIEVTTDAGEYASSQYVLSKDGSAIAISDVSFNNNNGQVKIFKFNGSHWNLIGEPINGIPDVIDEDLGIHFGAGIDLNKDGSIIAIGAPYYSVSGGVYLAGQIKMYKNINDKWEQIGETIIGTFRTGYSLDLSEDGLTLAVGDYYDDGLGALKVFKYRNEKWMQIGEKISGKNRFFGTDISLNLNSTIVASSAHYFTGFGNTEVGYTEVYEIKENQLVQIGLTINGLGIISDFSDRGSHIVVASEDHYEIYKNNNGNWEQIGQDISDLIVVKVLENDKGDTILLGLKNGALVSLIFHQNKWEPLQDSLALESHVSKIIINDEDIFIMSATRSNIKIYKSNFQFY